METKKEGEGADFSNFFNRERKNAPQPKYEEAPKISYKKYLAIAFFVVAIAVSGYLFYTVKQSAEKPAASYTAPAGYEMVYPNNEPPKLQKIK